MEGTLRHIHKKPESSSKKKGDKGASQVPEKWTFHADESEIMFAREDTRENENLDNSANNVADGELPRGNDAEINNDDEVKAKRKKTRSGLDKISKFIARSHTENGLVFRNLEAETSGSIPNNNLGNDFKSGMFRLQGRQLTYDGKSKLAIIIGSELEKPKFYHHKSHGTANRMSLFLNKRLLRLDKNVYAKLDATDIQSFKEGIGSDQENPSGNTESEDLKGLEIRADQLDVTFDKRKKIQSAAARCSSSKPIALQPLPDEDGEVPYKILGANLLWDNMNKVAIMETTDETVSVANKFTPRLEFKDGALTATKIRFDQKTWIAYLEDGVEIRSQGTREPILLTAGSAEVEFFESIRPMQQIDGLSSCFQDLKKVRQIHAWAAPGKRIEIQNINYSARADEAIWDSTTQELRLSGDGDQEFTRMEDGQPDILKAEEITYNRLSQLIKLQRNVRGVFFLPSSNTPDFDRVKQSKVSYREKEKKPGGFQSTAVKKDHLAWDFSSDSLELKVSEVNDCRGLELVSLSAHDNVRLECKGDGIILRGDDLAYDHNIKELRIYSRDERFQTLEYRTFAQNDNLNEKRETKINKIDSREIRVWYIRSPKLSTLDPQDQVVVRFSGDVTAAFYPSQNARKALEPEDMEDAWKLRADFLLLRLRNHPEAERRVMTADASGKVIFTAGDMNAMAKEAIYSEENRRLILKGGNNSKVQLLEGDNSYSHEIITLTLDENENVFTIKTTDR